MIFQKPNRSRSKSSFCSNKKYKAKHKLVDAFTGRCLQSSRALGWRPSAALLQMGPPAPASEIADPGQPRAHEGPRWSHGCLRTPSRCPDTSSATEKKPGVLRRVREGQGETVDCVANEALGHDHHVHRLFLVHATLLHITIQFCLASTKNSRFTHIPTLY